VLDCPLQSGERISYIHIGVASAKVVVRWEIVGFVAVLAPRGYNAAPFADAQLHPGFLQFLFAQAISLLLSVQTLPHLRICDEFGRVLGRVLSLQSLSPPLIQSDYFSRGTVRL